MKAQFQKWTFEIGSHRVVTWQRAASLLICLVGTFLATANASALAPDFRWVRQVGGDSFPSGSFGFDFSDINAVVLDRDGNPFVVGNLNGLNTRFTGPNFTNPVSSGGFYAKLDPVGNLLWSKSFGANVSLSDLTIDSSGNTYLVGSTNSPGVGELLLMKCDRLGNLLWSAQSHSLSTNANQVFNSGSRVLLDGATNIYVGGIFDPPGFGIGAATVTNGGNSTFDKFIAKFDSSGQALWARDIPLFDLTSSLVNFGLDPNTNLVFADVFTRPTNFGTFVLTNVGAADLYLAKYDPNGNLTWAKDVATGNFSGTGFFELGLKLDRTGNYYLDGVFTSSTVNFGSITLTNHATYEIYIAKLDPNGNAVWAKHAGGPTFMGNGSAALFLDGIGNIYQAGYYGYNLDFGGLVISNITGGSQSTFVAKYDAAGDLLWAANMSSFPQTAGNAVFNAYCLAGDAFGNIYTAGNLCAPGAIFGNLNVPAAHNNSVFFAKLDGPQLKLQNTNGSAVISWPTNATGLSLENTASLNGTWSPVTNLPTTVGNQFVITNSVASGSQFYRLRNF